MADDDKKKNELEPIRHARPSDKRVRSRQASFLEKHTGVSGQPRNDLWRIGANHIRRMKIAAGVPITVGPATRGLPAPVTFVGVQWQQIGPATLTIDNDQLFQGVTPVSAEVRDIAIDPRGTTDQVIYIATNDGGIVRSPPAGTGRQAVSALVMS